MPKPNIILALDMGTSSVRAMLFDRRGRELPGHEQQMPYVQQTTSDGGVETDAESLIERTVECIRRLMRGADKETKAKIAGVGISCFWHSLVGVGEDNRAVTPVYSWADMRSAPYVAKLRETLDADDYHGRTGCVLHPSFWPAKLLWHAAAHPEQADKVTRWMSFGEYLALRLFGSATCSISMASATGLFNQHTTDWDGATLAALPIRHEQLNPLGDLSATQSGIVAEFRRGLGPVAQIPWLPAAGDGACSNLGGGGTDDTRIALNIGTSAAMRIVVPAENLTIPSALFCYRVDRKRALLGGAFTGGGNIYAWLGKTLTLSGDAKSNEKTLAAMAPDSHGLTVLPFWAGERSPGWHASARASIDGMNLHTTPLDILRASLESAAYCYDTVRDQIQRSFPQAREIAASGGALQHDPVWTQILADVFGVPINVSKAFEASSRGAALLALETLGLIPDVESVSAAKGKTFPPSEANHQVYQEARRRYDALYARVLG
ncbi:gluconate kinase [Capsulimonas corticalis]|uniref:Gluconate kinase n=1 Tax=Capsulimonas corticalis TaxID=2219043 RepID=A0A402CUY0_9BACT|nr:gluconokinase [Capsulimonas corticalis]BDI30213.1 gluconate kinase [Capsulimonas corticalis]